MFYHSKLNYLALAFAGSLSLLEIRHPCCRSANDQSKQIVIQQFCKQSEPHCIWAQVSPDGAPKRTKDSIWQGLCIDGPCLEKI